jgi:hypothetical protein
MTITPTSFTVVEVSLSRLSVGELSDFKLPSQQSIVNPTEAVKASVALQLFFQVNHLIF